MVDDFLKKWQKYAEDHLASHRATVEAKSGTKRRGNLDNLSALLRKMTLELDKIHDGIKKPRK